MITAPQKINLCVFISGRGSNLKAILEACKNPQFPARVSCIISNKPNAGGLEYAKEYKIPYAVISHKDFATKQEFEHAILDALSHEPVDLICLAGFMRIISPYFLEQWGENIINIHPSLLPKYKGIDTHKRAIEAGDAEAGCTVHYVIPEMDAGENICQRKVKILSKDSPSSLEQKILIEEHKAYADAIRLVVSQRFVPTPPPISERETVMPKHNAVQESVATWGIFTQVFKVATISIIILLTLMALFLL